LSPLIHGQVHHFAARGLYDGLVLLGDHETGSYWNHITGECVHGPLQGYQLDVFPLLHTTVAQVLATHADAQIALSKQSLRQRLMAAFMERGRKSKRGVIPPGFKGTMSEADPRRPRMDMGLGVWTGITHRYYPLEHLRAHDNVILDELDGRRLLVYVGPTSGIPMALCTQATECAWQGDALHLDTGETIQQGRLLDAQGKPQPVGSTFLTTSARPMQVFTRWYGFAYTFPGCEIFEG
jgi:hypothetical protein